MRILPVVLIVLAIASCQKDSNQGNGNNNPSGNDSTLLWKYIETDPTLPPGSDTTYQEIYTYDSQKRLSHLYTKSGGEDIADLFYLGNDSLPYKAAGTHTATGFYNKRDTTFFFYSNGFISKDSTVEYDASTNQLIEITAFVYALAGDNTLVQYRHYSSTSTLIPNDETYFTLFKTYQNGNITVQEDTSRTYLFGYAHDQVSYDDKINPFYEVTSAHYPVLGYWINEQKNNPVDEILWDTPSAPRHWVSTYTYRADGRPLTVSIMDQPVSVQGKGIFLYTK